MSKIQLFPANAKVVRLTAATLVLLEGKVQAWLSANALAIDKILSRDIVPHGLTLTAVICFTVNSC